MKIAMCTISFRHQLISMESIISYAQHNGFDGVELWGAHAEAMYRHERKRSIELLESARRAGVHIPMISDYLSIDDEADWLDTVRKCKRLIAIASEYGVKRIRTFAGRKPSRVVGQSERARMARRLHKLCELCRAHGIRLVLETHPNTLMDTVASSLALMQELSHESAKVNVDFLHIWESGADPLEGFWILQPWADYFHLKNVTSALELSVFEPGNIYSASGSRKGIVPLGCGAINYRPIIRTIEKTGLYASLEWFGPHPLDTLKEDLVWLRETAGRVAL